MNSTTLLRSFLGIVIVLSPFHIIVVWNGSTFIIIPEQYDGGVLSLFSASVSMKKEPIDIPSNLSLVLLRAIGNSLPPRHAPNQTIVNLQFVLEHEHDFQNLQKHWFLNRLQADIEDEVIRLLEWYQQN